MRSQHQQLSFQDSARAEWHVNGHLVTIEVGVESRTNEWVKLNCFSFDQLRLEGLDTQTVKGRSTVEQHRVSFQYVFKDIPNYRFLLIYNFLG